MQNVNTQKIEDAVQADKEITLWMGDEISARKDFINKYANFNRVDEFEQKQIEEIDEEGGNN